MASSNHLFYLIGKDSIYKPQVLLTASIWVIRVQSTLTLAAHIYQVWATRCRIWNRPSTHSSVVWFKSEFSNGLFQVWPVSLSRSIFGAVTSVSLRCAPPWRSSHRAATLHVPVPGPVQPCSRQPFFFLPEVTTTRESPGSVCSAVKWRRVQLLSQQREGEC